MQKQIKQRIRLKLEDYIFKNYKNSYNNAKTQKQI